MKKTEDIVCLSMTSWEGDYMKAIVQMMTRLGRQDKVLFINYPSTWKDVLMILVGKTKGNLKRLMGWNERLTKEEGIQVYQFTLRPIFPVNWIKIPWLHDFLMNLQMTVAAREIKHAIRILKMSEPTY